MDKKETILEFYSRDLYAEALKIFEAEWPANELTPSELVATRGWCYYRTRNFAEAKKMARMAVAADDIMGWRLLTHIAAFVEGNDHFLGCIMRKFPGDQQICDACVIRAQDKNSTLSFKIILSIVQGQIPNNEIVGTDIIKNAARVFLEKGSEKGVITALGLYMIALEKYEKEPNTLHHRAAIWFWVSKAYERLGNMELSRAAAKKSLRLWRKQVRMDPDNPEFEDRLKGAQKRLEEISNAILRESQK